MNILKCIETPISIKLSLYAFACAVCILYDYIFCFIDFLVTLIVTTAKTVYGFTIIM